MDLPFAEKSVKLLDFDWNALLKTQDVNYILRSGPI
jgi:hypothetical protein